MLDKLCPGIGYSAAIHEYNVKKQYVLHKLSLNRNTYNTRLYVGLYERLVGP